MYGVLNITLHIVQFKSIDALTDGSRDTLTDTLTDAPSDVSIQTPQRLVQQTLKEMP